MKHLLLVDDDEDDRDFFLSVLDSIDSSLTCDTAENGSVALQYLSQQHARPDVIFLDLNMPVMNGKQFLTEVKKRDGLKDIPVIVLSTSADHSLISETGKLGAIDFITKPNKLSLLETRLREILTNPPKKQNV